jgi:hypothetical protein
LALGIYTSHDYADARIVKNIGIGTSAAALVLFLLGYFSGKIIVLECVTVFQITYFSLITVENLSPAFYGLSYLKYSCGYNLKFSGRSNIQKGRMLHALGYF